jgi:BolA protein
MGICDKITQKLRKEFAPEFLEVLDESEKHRGHANWIEGKSTHFRVIISASKLNQLSRVNQHRAITDVLDKEFEAGLHALSIEVT